MNERKELDIVDIKLLSYEDSDYLNYAVTYRNGQEKLCRSKIELCARSYDKDKVVDVESAGYVNAGFFRGKVFYIFIVTYIDGHKELVAVKEGKATCNELLLLSEKSIDGTLNKTTCNNSRVAVEVSENGYSLGTNELPQGCYLIGKDIPAGIYDFFVVYGHGGKLDIAKYDENDDITDGTWEFYWIGLKENYEHKEVLHVNCKDGYTVKIEGNVVVKITKSQKVKIKL